MSKECPALSWCRWLLFYYVDEDKAFRDWSMYWSRHLRGHGSGGGY